MPKTLESYRARVRVDEVVGIPGEDGATAGLPLDEEGVVVA
jgi:hypothetical protein